MNILAIDYGTKRIGLAWVNEDLGVVLPYGIIHNKNAGGKNLELIKLIKTERVQKVVIGLPLGLEGEENPNTKKIRAFAESLAKEIALPVEFVDERFSSYEADSMGGVATRDEKSAMVILQAYLAEKKST